MRKLLVAAFVVLSAAAPAVAQDHPIGVNFGFGWVFPTMDFKNDFNTGWNGTIGVQYNFSPTVSFLADYTYAHMNGPEKNITVFPNPNGGAGSSALIQSNHQMHVGTFDIVYNPPHSGAVGGYVLGGVGVYHRLVQLTTPATGYTTVCDPYWYVCYPTLVPVNVIIGDRSENDFGINFGGGVTFGTEGKFYVETRYHYVWGKTLTPPAGVTLSSTNSNAAYFPITLGVRW